MLYLIQCGGECGPLKIGWSDDPAQRLMELQIANPYALKIIATYKTAKKNDEFWFHHQMLRLHMRGEWFRFSPALVEAFEAFIVNGRPARKDPLAQ